MGQGGTPHLQGYLECANRVRFTQLRKIGGLQRAHFEIRRGTQQEAIDYCHKDGDVEEFGTKVASQQGKRTDLDNVIEAVKEGASVRDLWQNHSKAMIRYSKGILELRRELEPPRPFPTYDLSSFPFHPLIMDENKSHVIWGALGS